ncbi:ATP-binding protein [Taklimakanibacter deserti]|uniref:ATP-binding protein n=1 Tax=Taklimakanibacter deserti TaxID=2267839 RepID=UPI000E64ADE0
MRIPLWSKLRLAPRIAILIVATAIAAKLLDETLQHILPPSGFLVVNNEWLAKAAQEAEKIANETPAADRQAALAKSEFTHWLNFDITAEAPAYPQDDLPRLAREARAALIKSLNHPPEDILVMTEHFKEPEVKTNVVVISEIPTFMNTELLMSRDSMVVGDLHMAIRLKDRSWLVISPTEADITTLHYFRNLISLILTLFIVAIFSIWMARSIVKPLTNLAQAAEKLGRERETTPITGMKLPELASIADTFNEMQARLKKFVDERMQMLAAISHDLRTPLTRLRLYAETVPNEAQRTQILSDISDMETMVSTSLAFMSDDIHRESYSAVDLASLIISQCDNFVDAGRKVSYQGPDHAELTCRPVAVRRAISNLIDNGCKYGGEVCVTLTDNVASLVIDIRDGGPGIPADQTERAFAPFQRLEESRNRETGGTGLGLTIARDVVVSHGGDIQLMHDEKSFLVRVELPRPREIRASRAAKPHPKASARPAHPQRPPLPARKRKTHNLSS